MKFCRRANKYFLLTFIITICLVGLIYLLFGIKVHQGDGYVAQMIKDKEANQNGHYSAFIYNSNEYVFLGKAEGFYFRGEVKKSSLGLMGFRGIIHKNKNYEIYSFVNDFDNLFLYYDMNDIFESGNIFYRDDLVFPEINTEGIEQIELISCDRNLFHQDNKNEMIKVRADYYTKDRDVIESILNKFVRNDELMTKQYLLSEMDSKELGTDKFFYDRFGNKVKAEELNHKYYVVLTFKGYTSDFCYLMGELSINQGTVRNH